MKLKTKFILFMTVINLLLILLSIPLIETYPFLFVITEAIILITVALSFHLYREFIRPLNLISDGIETIRSQDFNTKFVKVGQIEMDRLITMYNQMISQLREEKIKQQEQHYFLERLIQASPSGIIILDFDNNLTNINPAAGRLLNVTAEQVTGHPISRQEGQLWRELESLESGNAKIIHKNGIQAYKIQKSHFLDRGFHHHFIIIEELTEEIIKTEKKAYDKVIRMMSHEINNSIGAINSILNSVLNYKKQLKPEDRSDYQQALNVAIERNHKLNRFMSNFAGVVRTPHPVKEETDLHQLLKNTVTLMSAECSNHDILVEWNLAEGMFTVTIDVQQMEQVLLNILKNSIEAINGPGKITIHTENSRRKHLTISDSGTGIPPEVRSQLFSPFFSTKKEGQGIGLTLIREILLNHGFRFSLGEGESGLTEFSIDFSSSRI